MKPQEKKKMNYWPIVLGVLGVLLAGAGLFVWIWYTASFSFYENKKEGFKIPYPKSWKLVEKPQKDALVAFISPKSGVFDLFQENISLTMVDQSKNPLSVEAYGKLAVDQMKVVFNDLKMNSAGPTTISGRKAYKIVFTVPAEKPFIMIIYCFMYSNTTGYNLAYFGEKAVYEKRDKFLVEALIRTMKIYF